MSHKATLDVEFKDVEVLDKVLSDLGIEHKIAESGKTIQADLYQGAETGVAVFKMPGWQYPVVVKADGTAVFDNFNGKWGNLEDLNKVRQDYASGVTVKKAQSGGLRVKAQTTLADGSIQLRLTR